MSELPSWQPLEGGSVPISDGAGRGRVVAVVASGGAVRGGWAAEAALDLARAWSASGKKVVLADAALDHPALHVAAGVDNDEGLSDASLYGASVRRVARPVDDGAFFVITAGSPVADANLVARTPRWQRLCDGFGEAGVTLILFVRDGDNGCEAFLAAASDVILFAERGEAPPAIVEQRASMVRAITGPGSQAAGAPGAPGAAEGAPPSPSGTSSRASTIPTPGGRAPSRADSSAGPGAAGPKADPPSSAPGAARQPSAAPARKPPTRRGSAKPAAASPGRMVVVVVLLLVLTLVVLGLLGVVDIPMISPEPAGAAGAVLGAADARLGAAAARPSPGSAFAAGAAAWASAAKAPDRE